MEDQLKKFLYKGRYTMLALDHRHSLAEMFSRKGVEDVGQVVYEFKKAVLKALFDLYSAVLIDPDTGLKAYKEVVKNRQPKPFLLSVEESGYKNVDGERLTKVKYEPSYLKKLGASGAKILLYFNPNYPSAKHQLDIAKSILAKTNEAGLPLFIEIVVYSKKGERITDDLILESVKSFLSYKVYPKVFKLQPPERVESSQEITKLLSPYGIDWIVLTQGVSFEVFEKRLEKAVAGGCKGFLAGRSIWKEAVDLHGPSLKRFLETTSRRRFQKIFSVVLNY